MLKVFNSYSHKDEEHRAGIHAHVAMLRREGIISSWYDKEILPGEHIDHAVSAQLEQADIILLLVSADFLNSAYCYDLEMKRALKKHQAKTARVLPVIVRPCDWKNTPFAKLLAMPADGVAISSRPDRDEAYLEVAQGIRRVAEALRTKVDPPLADTSRPVPRPTSATAVRLRRNIGDRDRDQFLDDTFGYICTYFENSLEELRTHNAQLETKFKRLDATSFSATAYDNGKRVADCVISCKSSALMSAGISFSYNTVGGGYNEILSIEDDGAALFVRPLLTVPTSGSRGAHLLTQEAAADHLWSMFLSRLGVG